MNCFDYIINNEHQIEFEGNVLLTNVQIVDAINFCNNALFSLHVQTQAFDINIFEVMGMRNLSGAVGEYFAKSVVRFSNNNLESNLHQDGYPDLLAVDSQEKKNFFLTLYEEIDGKKYPKDKASFSPYRYGGIEVKATCGNTLPSRVCPKPLIGEPRVGMLTSFEWKAHHRETEKLLGLLWDFFNGVPAIVACFYRNDLTQNDWGKIVHPHEGGGRTTSVSIMPTSAVKKMCEGWIAVIDNEEYKNKLAARKWIGRIVE